MKSYQQRVDAWMKTCFGDVIRMDRTERAFRFLEEALELAQSIGATKEEAQTLVEYVFGRKAGDPAQEAGGVAVCLSALCSAIDLDMMACAQNEITRCEENTERIRAKHAAKPQGIRSALPGYASNPAKKNEEANG